MGTRKIVVVVCAIPAIAAFTAILLNYKGLIDVADFGLPDAPFYIGAFVTCVVAILPILLIWRCPACRTYLGREFDPERCPVCGARFR